MRMRKTLCLWIFALVVCSSTFASSYPFEHPDPEADFLELKARSVTSLSPEEVARLGWYYHVYDNANDEAKELLIEAITKAPDNVWALYGMVVLNKVKADFEEQRQYVLMLCDAAADHPLAEIAFNSLRQLVGSVDGVVGPGKKLLNDIIYNDRVNDPFALNMAASALSSMYALEGNTKSCDRVEDRLNYIREWRLAGPFGQYKNLSFFSTLPPETERRLGDKYDFSDEAILTKTYKSDTGKIDAYFMKAGVYFAETFLYTKEPREVLLVISSGKSINCYLNGNKIYEKDLIREFGPATEAVSVTLNRGWNRIALKFVSYQGSNIFVQVLSTDNTVPAVKVSSKHREVPDLENYKSEKLVSSGIEDFTEKLRANPKDPLAPVILAICHSLTGNLEQTKDYLYRSLEIEPDYAYANYLLAQTLDRDNTQPKDIARGEAKRHFERAIELAGTYPSALSKLAGYSADEGRDTRAIEKLKEVIEQAPGFYAWHKKLYELYTVKGWEKERHRELIKVSGLLHESIVPFVMQRNYYYSKRMFDKYHAAVKKLQESSVRRKHLAAYYKKMGDIDKAIKEHRKAKKFLPYDRDVYSSLSELYEAEGKTLSAQREMEKLHKFYPDDTHIMLRLAQLYSLRGNDRKAEELYREVLIEDPVNEAARKALELAGKEDFFDEYEIDIWQYVNDESLREKYSSYSAVIVIDQTVEEIFPNGSTRAVIHEVVLVNNKQGIERWAEVSVPSDSEFLELRTIKSDGTIIEPEAVERKKTISMTDIAEGDYIEKKYIVRMAPRFGKRKAHLGQRFFFQTHNYPMVISQYIIAAPKDMDLKFETVEMNESPETWEEAKLRFYKWERRDIPEIKPEPRSVAQYEYIPNLHPGFNVDPEFQSKTAVNSNIGALKASREVILKTEELTKELTSLNDKIRAIYEYVCTEIDGGAGSPVLSGAPGHTLANKRGDRLSLMKAMLNAAGIPSNVVMVLSRTVEEPEIFPAYYSYPLLAVSDPNTGETQFLDLNQRYNSYGFIPPQYQGAQARILNDYPAGTRIDMTPEDWDKLSTPITTPVLPLRANGTLIHADLEIKEDGSLSGTLNDSYAGSHAASLRSFLHKIEEFNLRNSLERGLNANYRGAELNDYEITALKEINKPLGVIYRFEAPNYATVSNGNLIFRQGFYRLDLGKTYVTVPERETPMGLYQAQHMQHDITIKLPEGCEISEMPESLSLDTQYGIYKLETKAEDNTFTLHREFYMPVQKIYPEDYQGFADFCDKIDKVEEKDLKAVLPAPTELEESTEPAEEKPAEGRMKDDKVEHGPPEKETSNAPEAQPEKDLEEVTQPQ